jgi:hypothetical protein
MIKHKVFIKYWKLPELQGLTVLEAGKKILELEEILKGKNFKKATFLDVAKFKIKWILKILWLFINYPFDSLFDLI